MGLLGSSDPTKQTEKVMANESKTEEKQLKQAIKDVSNAEKQEAHAQKAEHGSHGAHDKLAKEEQKLAAELHKLTSKHDAAVSKEHAAAKDINTKTSEHQRLAQETERKKNTMEQLQHKHHTNEGILGAGALEHEHRKHESGQGTASGQGMGQSNMGAAQPGMAQSGTGQYGMRGTGQGGMGQSGMGQSGMGQSGMNQSAGGMSGMGQSGMGQSGMGQSGMNQSAGGMGGMGQSGMGQSGMGQSGMGQSGMGQSGMGQSGMGPSAGGMGGQGYGGTQAGAASFGGAQTGVAGAGYGGMGGQGMAGQGQSQGMGGQMRTDERDVSNAVHRMLNRKFTLPSSPLYLHFYRGSNRRMYRAPRKLLRVFRSGVTQHVPLLLSTTNAHLSNLALSTCNLLDHLVSPLRQLLYPLDVVKTRQQLDTGKKGMGMIQTFRSILAHEGASRLYRGIVPPLMLEAPKRAVKFAANGWWGAIFTSNGQTKNTQSLAILTGCFAGATESVVVTPFELVKIRLQDKSSTFKGPLDVIRHSLRTSGPLGLYQGMESTFWRHWWWNGGYFGAIFWMRSLLPKAATKQGELGNNLLAGTVGGFVGTTLNTPFDVVKSRVQLKGTGEWAYPALASILRAEGLGGIYKGFAPKVLRLAPGGGVLLLVVEALSSVFRNYLGSPYI
ncbi:MAG: hypothetical protein TREMPRED_001821 [Tremellales sp. Tagirdzhanova-0007]|nr:MAG: hypothetical protein TREMPRED_001821 [Tremellales sp. Tagirdzhanova-0007]